MDHRLIDIANSQGHLLSRAVAAAAGVDSQQWRRLRDRGEWQRLAADVVAHRATAVTWEMRVRAAASWLGRDAALFGSTALKWMDFSTVTDDERVHFLVPRRRRSIRPWVTIHSTLAWNTSDLRVLRDVRCTTATRAIIDHAATRPSASELESVIDEAIRRRLTSLPTLIGRVDVLGGPGRPGTRLLRELLLDSGGESYLERRFLRLVREAGLPRPACQVVHRRDGRFVARVDFEYAHARVVVEVSGRLGHTSDRDRQRDARRRNELQAAGWTVIEFTTRDVIDDPAYVVATLRSHVHVAAIRRRVT